MIGIIPNEIGQMTNLQELSLANNSFEGPVPSEIAQLSRLETLMLNNNFFDPEFDQNIGLIPTLKNFNFISTPRDAKVIQNALAFD